MTDSITITGLHYLVGHTVSAFIAGLDCGDYVVDQYGQIAVPVGSDPDGLFGPSWLVAASSPGSYGDAEVQIVITDDVGSTTVNVPVVVGFTYTSQGQLLRPFDAAEIKSPKGPALGKKRRAHMIAALVHNTAGISFGTDLDDTLPANFLNDRGDPLPLQTPFDGVHWDTLKDDPSYDTMLGWQLVRPYPAVIVQIGPFLNTEDE